MAGYLPKRTVHELFRKKLIYLDIPIQDDDIIQVPPLEGFVMNRVLGDYFENLLYKIFVSLDERTTVSQVSNILQVDINMVKHAISLYIRLGFAKKKNAEPLPDVIISLFFSFSGSYIIAQINYSLVLLLFICNIAKCYPKVGN